MALDLEMKGYTTFVPFAFEHSSIDLISWKCGILKRYQVKYSNRFTETGAVKVKVSDKKGKPFDLSTVDYVAVWVEDWSVVKYLPSGVAAQETVLTLDSKKWEEL